MRTILLLPVFLASCLSALAQTTTDQIYYIDKRHFEVVVDEITDREIVYFLSGDAAKSKPLRVNRDQIWKIVYPDGETEIITPIKEVLEVPQAAAEKKVAASDPPMKDPKPSKTTVTLKNTRPVDPEKKRVHFLVGGEAAYVINALEWSDDAGGMGMELGLGASASLTVPVTQWLSATVSGGLLKWDILRNFRDSLSNNLLFERTNTFKMIPIHAGVKIYPAKGFYISPQVGYTIYEETGSDQKPEETAVTFFNFKGGKIGYRGELGYEHQINRFVLGLSAHYTSVVISKMNEFSQIPALNYFGGRISIGYSF